MNVLHINTHDSSGGAGRAAQRLHNGLKSMGVISRMLVRTRTSAAPDVLTISEQHDWTRRADSLVRFLTDFASLQYWAYPSTHLLPRHPWVKSAGIINLHNIHGGYFAITALPALARTRPIVWTLHDMWSLTGHCSYSGDCERWRSGCGECPDLEVYPKLRRDTTALLWKTKRLIYQKVPLTLVTPSEWLAERVRESPLLRHCQVHCIPNSVDTEVYHPFSQAAAREILGLPPDQFVLLFAAEKLSLARKGADLLLAALQNLPQDWSGRVEILLAGELGPGWPEHLPFPVHVLGTATNERMMAACYNAADLFVLPTRQDNLPNGLLESMACGTPCVAFAVGGVPEAVRHLETGFLAPAGASEALARGIAQLLTDRDLRQKISSRSREVALRQYPLIVQASRYAALYTQLLSSSLSHQTASSTDA